MNKIILPLDKVTKSDIQSVGGKAALLGEMTKAGLPVPKGFVVTLGCFNHQGELDDSTKLTIKNLLDRTKLYAVRSSGVAEDAEGASWAGQFETYLDTKSEDIISKIEKCHNSAKTRAIAYARDKQFASGFKIAVVVQEMIHSEFSGVLFTKDPVSGKDNLVTEYVEGLGEELVSGTADPKRITFGLDKPVDVPFDILQLVDLANKTEQLFGLPQDIEWAWAENKMWLVQARPITVTQEMRAGYYIGEPEDLFYWGPTRAKPTYFSDFMAAIERFFMNMVKDPCLPNPPKTIALFHKGQNVWLINEHDFAEFTEKTFVAYEKLNQLEADIAMWEKASQQLDTLSGSKRTDKLIEAWVYTEFAEFSLYGAETVLIKRLSRFDNQTRQEIWGAFTVPDKPTFLSIIDQELFKSQDVAVMAKKYPWIKDGYDGISSNPKEYFEERLKIVSRTGVPRHVNNVQKRTLLIKKLSLTDEEVKSLSLARKLAEFMDNRKAWMMQTRHLITTTMSNIEFGWFYRDGKISLIGEEDAKELWQRYVDFKSSSSAVVGIVASNGGKHFINGEVIIVVNSTDVVEAGKIVIVPSTSPSYVPLMRSAKALITDHGGMMSHAAIVAREFNLPCIVGTRQATKVLNNGDRVVIDLVKGEVIK